MNNGMHKQRGVTLIELLTVVAVIAILASIAIPSYRRYLLRAQRSDATTALLRLASAQEKHVLQYGTYVTVTGNITKTHADGGLGLLANSERGYYGIELESTTTGYKATATPVSGGGQATDTSCAKYVIDESGTRRAYNSASADTTGECFK